MGAATRVQRARNGDTMTTHTARCLTTGLAFGALCMAAAAVQADETARGNEAPTLVNVRTKDSILHLGSIDSFDVTDGGKKAAEMVMATLVEGDPEAAREAIRIYDDLIPNENFGGEYTALRWFCRTVLADETERAGMLADPFVNSFYRFFADDRFAVLREYLVRKYKLAELKEKDVREGQRRQGFLEDFILFNNPVREEWEKTSKMLEVLDIREGQKIADVGSGPGFFSFKFADMVGPKGKVYAIDINDQHIDYVKTLAKRLKVRHIETVTSRPTDIGVKDQVDLAFMCSLYHIVYSTASLGSTDAFIGSIRKALKPGGIFAVVDNAVVDDHKLPYHGPYIDRELVIAQLHHYGFDLVSAHQFIPQRYILLFRRRPDEGFALAEHTAPPVKPLDTYRFEVQTRAPLLHVPNDLEPDITRGGNDAAIVFLSALKKKSAVKAADARARYLELMPKERHGDEYTAFLWFCDYLIATPEERAGMLADPFVKAYFDALGGDEFTQLISYISTRYPLKNRSRAMQILGNENNRPGRLQRLLWSIPVLGRVKRVYMVQEDMYFWRDFVLFNNPNREQWEGTSRIVEAVGVKPGEAVADIGSGPGCYTFRFSGLVGEKGRVYAVDVNERHLDYVKAFAQTNGVANVETVVSKFNDVCLPEKSVDAAFICSLYSIIYSTSIESVKDEFVASIRKALRPGGRLIVADNDVVLPPGIPYHGPFIAREMIVAQMAHYGFELADTAQFTPQRYVLTFRVKEGGAAARGTDTN